MTAQVINLFTRQPEKSPEPRAALEIVPPPQIFVPHLSEDDLVSKYLLSYGGTTEKDYRRDIAHFRAWLDAQGIGLYDVYKPHAGDWREYMLDVAESAPSTARRRMTSVEGMYKTAMAEGWWNRNPFFRVKKPDVSDNIRYPGLCLDDVQVFMNWAYYSADLRTRALVVTLSTTGLRVSELCKARIEDIQPGEDGKMWLHVVRKGGRRGKVELPQRTLAAIREYVGDRTHGPILLGDKGRALARQVAWAIFRAAGDSALPHLTGKLHPHVSRHMFVSAVLLLSGDIKEAQFMAGHRDINNTIRYTHILKAIKSKTADDLEKMFGLAA